MLRLCEDCAVIYDDVDFITICPHGRVDGGPQDPILIFVGIALLAAALEDYGLGVTYRG